MNEQEWLRGGDPAPMLEFLRGKVSDRKMRLFTCAVESSHRLKAPFAELVDRYVEGLISDATFLASLPQARPGDPPWSWETVLASLPQPDGGASAVLKAKQDMLDYRLIFYNEVGNAEDDWRETVAFLHDIFGNPFHPLALNPDWLTPTVQALAQATYQERDLPSGHLDAVRLAVLADALEEAGCIDAQVLGHLRGPGPHIRGCFVLNLVLGRE